MFGSAAFTYLGLFRSLLLDFRPMLSMNAAAEVCLNPPVVLPVYAAFGEPALGGREVDEHQDHEQGNECSHVTSASKIPSHLIPQCLTSRSAE
jgi:hypothetical protein